MKAVVALCGVGMMMMGCGKVCCARGRIRDRC